MVRRHVKVISLCFTLVIGSLIMSACQGQGTLTVEDAWARPGSAGSNSAAYFRIENSTNREDFFLSASSPAANQAEIHMSMMGADETMSMIPQESVPVPGSSQVSFEPGGLHVMLVDLQTDLAEGEQIELILNFQEAGEISLQVPVEQR